MDRRTYIKSLGLATGGVLIAPQLLISCKDKATVNFKSAYTNEPFSTLDEIRHFARQSSGHFVEEMSRKIATKDAEAIFNFVTQEFKTIPSTATSIDAGHDIIRFGKQGLLRSGKGTLREKSDLLFDMLKDAGFNPTYHYGSFSATPKIVNQVYCKPSKDHDNIEVSEKDLKRLTSGNQNVDGNKLIDEDGSKSEALQQHILANLPNDVALEMQDFQWLDTPVIEAPIVRITVKGKVKDLNFIESKSFTEFAETSTTVYDLDRNTSSKAIENVRIILQANYTNDTTTPVELCRGEWDIEDLIGNQVMLQFASTLPAEQFLNAPIQQVNSFLPVLSLRNPKLSLEERKKQSFQGVGFDMFGNTFQEDGDGAIRMNGFKLNETEQTDTGNISEIKVKLSDNEYPKIQVRLAPLDANGKPVLGLPASAFSILDQEQGVAPLLIQNTLSPKVLVLYDTTSSMPIEFYAYGLPKAVEQTITKAFESSFYDCKIKTVPFSTQFKTELDGINVSEFDHVVFIGDGGEFDTISAETFTKKFKDVTTSYHYKQAPYDTYSFRQNDAKAFFGNDQHRYFNIDTLEQDLTSIAKAISAKDLYPYVLEYEAPLEDDNLIHDVEIGVNGNANAKKKTLRYVMNREREYENAPQPCALQLVVEYDQNYTQERVERHLAGYNYKTDSKVLPKHIQNVKDSVLGSHYLFFEADKATLPTIMDDVITAQLSFAEMAESRNGTEKELIEKLDKAQPLPAGGLTAFAPIRDASGQDYVTFENAFQSCLYSEYVDTVNQQSVRSIDMLPTSDIRTFAKTKSEAFKRTLKQTSLLAVSEGTLYGQSTWRDLQGKTLSYFNNQIDFKSHLEFIPLKDFSYSNHLLFDKSLSTTSYWRIDKTTGALLGILPDGSGGGKSIYVQSVIKEVKTIIELYNQGLKLISLGSVVHSIVALYGQLLIRLYGMCAITIAGMNANNLEKDVGQALKKAVYEAVKLIVFGKFKHLGNFESLLDYLFDPDWSDVD